jgi:hypothetical protein
VKNRKALVPASDEYGGPSWVLSLTNGAGQSFHKATDFIVALRKALTEAPDIEQLFAIWERNVDTVRAISRQTNRSAPRGVIAQNLVTHLKSRAIALAKENTETSKAALKVDKSVLSLSEPKRVRSKVTPALCGQPAVPPLRSHAIPCASHSIRPTQRPRPQSKRRIHSATVRYPP